MKTFESSDSFEKQTIYSLGISAQGIEELKISSMQCADMIETDRIGGMNAFRELSKHLRNFYVFEQDVTSVFGMDKDSIGNGTYTLKTAEEGLTRVMQRMIGALEGNDIAGLSSLLRKDIPEALSLFTSIFPVLSKQIEEQYLATA